MQMTIKIDKATYDKIKVISKQSGISITKLADMAWEYFLESEKFKLINKL